MTSKSNSFKINLLFICVIFIYVVTNVASELPKILATLDYVLDAGANYTVLCEGNRPVKWLSNTLKIEPQTQGTIWTNVHIDDAKPQHHSYKYASRLSIENVTYAFTGFYFCYHDKGSRSRYRTLNEFDMHYLYVKDPDHLAVNNYPNSDSIDCIDHDICEAVIHAYETEIIPCRPTSPDVSVTFQDVSFPEAHTIYPYDPRIGFTFTARTLGGNSYTYKYECIFTRGNLKYKQSWTILALQSPSLPSLVPKVQVEDLNKGHSVIEADLLLKCTIETNVKVKMDWITPLGLISKNKGSKAVVIDRNLYGGVKSEVLLIKNSTKEDSGFYECIVKDSENHIENASIMVQIYDKNEFFITITEVNGHYKVPAEAGTPNVTWSMSIYSNPAVSSILWLNNKNERIPTRSTKKYFSSQSKKSTMLTIKDIELEDFGNYKLIVHNRLGQQSLELFLNVTDKPSLDFHLEPCYFVNTSAEISCTAKGNPLPKVELRFKPCLDGRCSYDTMKSRLGDENFTVTSHAVLWAHKPGIVECHASNILGSKSIARNFYVSDVRNGLDIFGLEDTNTVPLGGTITLTCAVSKFLYNESLSFRHSNKPLIDYDHKRISLERRQTDYSNSLTITIKYVTFADAGIYSCIANHYGWDNPVHRNITLIVKVIAVHPVIDSTNMKNDIRIELPNSREFYCTFNGIPAPTITWFKDNYELIEKPNHILFMDGKQKLLLNRTEPNDEGLYRCVGSNKMGSVARQVYLEFTNKPNKPEKICAWPIVKFILATVSSILAVLLAIVIVSYKIIELIKFSNFEKGALKNLNPDLGLDEQAELLPYDKKWEFPIEKLKLGKQLGFGAFGVVMKGEAKGLIEGETFTTVAVKICKKNTDQIYIKALISELKIMVHLGKHLNVVNLMGACTKNLAKKELLVMVEYCRFGNLQNYLHRHRENFVDQVDHKTRKINYSIGQEILERHYSVSSNRAALVHNNSSFEIMPKGFADYEKDNNYFGTTADTDVTTVSDDEGSNSNSAQPEWRSNYGSDYRGDVRPISTKDLLVWASQVARGMEYLVSRKVLHGDLAARNILLAENNVVKICDFGLAKNMYSSEIYKRKTKGTLPLPMKWMAVESIKDYIFSAQSDVWSFGIVLWEFFSLGITPYPGMPADDRLYNKLVNGYRMESPDYAPQNIYNIMLNCWDSKPGSRPTFGRLSKILGSILEDRVREYYIHHNNPYLVTNTKRLEDGQSDYLTMVTAPDFQILSSPHLQVKNSSMESNKNEL